MTDGDLPTCPVCGRPFEIRYSLRTFTPAMVGPDDETCRTDRFVHVHEARGLDDGDEKAVVDDGDEEAAVDDGDEEATVDDGDR